MSRALRPGIGLETQFAFFSNCSDASPLDLTAKPGVVCTTSIVPWVWVPQIEPQHTPFVPFPVIYHGQLGISENLRSCPRHCFFGLSSARIVASRHDQKHPGASSEQLGSGTLGIVLSASTQVPHAS